MILQIAWLRMEFLDRFSRTVGHMIFSWNSRLAVIYLAATIMIAFLIWLWRGRPNRFLAWLLPARIYRHRSNIVDIQVFMAIAALTALGALSLLTFTPLVTNFVLDLLIGIFESSVADGDPDFATKAVATIIMIVTLDFCKYWAHYIHHENRYLWPFHALHHSAEVLTPLTATRNHPVFLLIRSFIYSLVVGLVQALMLFAIIGKIDILTIGTANVGYVLFNFLGSNLRHSHIWLSYGPVLEHIFISPAQHQIHHSRAKKHFNKNYGEVFAVWDWLFGTLYIPTKQETLEFGLADAAGTPIEQPHGSLSEAMLVPFLESWRQLKRKHNRKRHKAF